jgi:hypothetical protein
MMRADDVNSASSGETDSYSLLGEWLPSVAQMENALRLRFDQAPDPDELDPRIPRDSILYASMRQGMGMIVVAGMVAGLIPFLWNWISAGRIGTAVPLAEIQGALQGLPGLANLAQEPLVAETLQNVAGLPPAFLPGWMASGLSAFGIWINTPLQWLLWWIVYGLAVLLIAKMLGAPTTLQQFYTLTSFGFLPLVLTGLGPIQCVGAIATVLALLWAFVVYAAAVRSATRLSLGLSVLCTILPAATLLLLAIALTVATAVAMATLIL